MRFLIAAVLVLCLAGSSLAERPRYVNPSKGSSWTWRPNNPIFVPYTPPPPNSVRVLTMPDGFTPASRAAISGGYSPVYSGGYYSGTGAVGGSYGTIGNYSGYIIVNPHCK